MNIVSINNKLLNSKWLMNKSSVWSLYNDVNRLSEIRMGGLYGKVFGNPVLASTPTTDLIPSEQESDDVGDMAIISIAGTMVKGAGELEQQMLGLVNTDDISEAIDKVAADYSVKSVVLNFASPGGEVTGIPELARKIKALDSIKPVYCFTEFSMQSAAYYLGSQCRYIGMTPSAEVGSIGVYMLLLDITEKLQKEGIKPNLISSGDFKAMGSEMVALKDNEREILVNGVVKTHQQFKDAVLASRPKANVQAMEGLSYEGDDALANGLVDMVTDDFATFLEQIQK